MYLLRTFAGRLGSHSKVFWAVLVGGGAGGADQDEVVAGFVGAVGIVAGGGLAVGAAADVDGLGGEFMIHAGVEDVEGALPEALVTVFLAVLGDAAVNLVDLLEAVIFH